jgi:hypothetical protein
MARWKPRAEPGGEEERLNCALRVPEQKPGTRGRGRKGFFGSPEIPEVNLAVKTALRFFTESLILAQNERWRRV